MPNANIRDAMLANTRGGGASFTLGNRMVRLLFNIIWMLIARWTPRRLNPLRIAVLRMFGANIGKGAVVYGSAKIWLPSNISLGQDAVIGPEVNCYSIGMIGIGARTIISQRVHICTGSHDFRDPAFQLIAKPISIGANCWIASEAFVGPGVIIGEGTILGARACAFNDLVPNMIYRGNPAVAVGKR